jgi:hypothetical protein
VRLHGLAYAFDDMVSGQRRTLDRDLILVAYQFIWLRAA